MSTVWLLGAGCARLGAASKPTLPPSALTAATGCGLVDVPPDTRLVGRAAPSGGGAGCALPLPVLANDLVLGAAFAAGVRLMFCNCCKFCAIRLRR